MWYYQGERAGTDQHCDRVLLQVKGVTPENSAGIADLITVVASRDDAQVSNLVGLRECCACVDADLLSLLGVM